MQIVNFGTVFLLNCKGFFHRVKAAEFALGADRHCLNIFVAAVKFLQNVKKFEFLLKRSGCAERSEIISPFNGMITLIVQRLQACFKAPDLRIKMVALRNLLNTATNGSIKKSGFLEKPDF